MDSSKVRKRRWSRLLKSPIVLWPTIGGLAALAISGGSGVLAMIGLAGVVIGVGSAIWKLTAGGQKLTDQAIRDLEKTAYEQHLDELRDLQQRLRSDKDPRTGEALRDLRDLYKRMHGAGLLKSSEGPRWQQEIREQVGQVYASSLSSLQRTYELWKAAKQMTTDEIRDRLLTSRDEVVQEVHRTISHLSKTVDQLQAKALERELPENNLGEVRSQLEQGLEVARNVEKRMAELEIGVGSRAREAL